MHATLPTHVLALAPDSLASLGQLDNDSLSELWAVFTRCKDSLQNGRRLENLSWRLWFDSARRDGQGEHSLAREGDAGAPTPQEIQDKVAADGWSDPEWEETSDSDSDDELHHDDRTGHEPASPAVAEPALANATAASPPGPARGRTQSVPAAPGAGAGGTAARPPLGRRGFSREWKAPPVISGGSLQRMIADLQRLPDIPAPGKARSLHEVPTPSLAKPPLGSRGSSAPDNLNAAVLHASAPSSPTGQSDARSGSSLSRRTTPTASPSMSRSASSPAHGLVTAAAEEPAAVAPPPLARRLPSNLAMSAMPSTASLNRRSRPSSPCPSPPTPDEPAVTMTPSETAMLALSASRNRSDANLTRRAQSTAELASSFKPQSYVKGFEPSPSSLETRPGPGAIAPPPTPMANTASLAASPPRPSASSRNGPSTATPLKVPPPAAAAPTPGPSAFQRGPKAPGTGKKIFFISSPESDEDHSSRSRESRGMKVVVTPPSANKPRSPRSFPRASPQRPGDVKGKQPVVQLASADADDDDDDEWDSDSDDDSSGWGSEYSTESDIGRNSAANGPGGRRAGADQQSALFAKRPAGELQRTASTATMGGPGELTRRPPGLLSQLFHPDQFVDDSDRARSSVDVMRRNHKSMSALPTLSQLHASKSTGALDKGRAPGPQRSKSFLRGKPDHVELESSSEEEGDEKAAPTPGTGGGSSEYEDVDDDAEAQQAAAAALARRQRELEEAAVLAPPQTPRTTRRAMLATELSESLRRNLLWERQMRNRVMGGAAPRRPVIPGQPLPQRPASSTQLAPPPPPPPSAPPAVSAHVTGEVGTRAPHPSPATRHSPPIASRPPAHHHHSGQPAVPDHGERHPGTAALPRRHTTGTGLYLQAQLGGNFASARRPETDSELSQSSDDEDDGDEPADSYGAAMVQRVW
ncbi:uncharacterized protein JCM10292_001100 [Rhodotorula paludigena]|uniref:uncharacterized protein n=1 Tax=Rhodotorula paludigena TaxID=86838 RepID=UPI003180D27B